MRDQEALEEYSSCAWENIPNLAGLAETFPPALSTLEEVEQLTWKRVHPPDVGEEVFRVLQLGEVLGRPGAAAKLFAMWHDAGEPARRALHQKIWLDLANEGYWKLALTFEGEIASQVRSTGEYLSELNGHDRQLIEDSYSRQLFSFARILNKGARTPEATKLLDQWENVTSHKRGDEKFCDLGTRWMTHQLQVSEGELMVKLLDGCHSSEEDKGQSK